MENTYLFKEEAELFKLNWVFLISRGECETLFSQVGIIINIKKKLLSIGNLIHLIMISRNGVKTIMIS